jgi:hypothetical protein
MLRDEREYLLGQIEKLDNRLYEAESTIQRILRTEDAEVIKLKAENAVLVVALTALSLRGDQVGSTRK